MKTIIFIWIFGMSVIAISVYGIDKYKAIHNKWRIQESTLIGIALLGGGIGAYLGMRIFHHKTKHKKFQILIPLSCFIWIGIGSYFGLR